MCNVVIGLCGGSGSGKTSLAFGLEDRYPGKVTVFHLDDYFRPEDEIPKLHGMSNWDDPRSFYYEKMFDDLAKLKSGKSVIINTKSPRLNKNFLETGKRIPLEFKPRPLIIVEGFLVLYFKPLRDLLDFSIYLDAPYELHTSRRLHGKLHNFPVSYNELVLKPMHKKYVYPYKKYADLVINIQNKSKAQVLEEAIKSIIL